MAHDVYTFVNQPASCINIRGRLRKHSEHLELFHAASWLEFVAIDLLGPLPKIGKGYKYVLVITDRLWTISRAIPLEDTKSPHLLQRSSAVGYILMVLRSTCLPMMFRTSHRSSSTRSLTCFLKNYFTTAYHSQTNGQV